MKYKDFTIEIQRMWNVKTKAIKVIIVIIIIIIITEGISAYHLSPRGLKAVQRLFSEDGRQYTQKEHQMQPHTAV